MRSTSGFKLKLHSAATIQLTCDANDRKITNEILNRTEIVSANIPSDASSHYSLLIIGILHSAANDSNQINKMKDTKKLRRMSTNATKKFHFVKLIAWNGSEN